MADKKRFFIHTLGCKVNQYETQAMRELLVKTGFSECLPKETADIYIINTCTVTHRADSESRYWAGAFHRANPDARIIITGCCAEKDAAAFSSLPGVMHVIKNSEKGRIAIAIGEDEVTTSPGHQVTRSQDALTISDFKNHTKAFVKIQDGCENFCAYCKVPHVRGPVRSRPVEAIAGEVERLVSKGFKEVVLTGICLGAWGLDLPGKPALIDVLKALNNMAGSFRIRLSSIEPKYVTDELIDYMEQNERMCRHLHIPIQSGDDEILGKMNRPYTAGWIRDLIIKVRARMEGVGITTDIMVGFPGESDKHFRNTFDLIKEIRPVRTHVFPFSARQGTAAYSMDNRVPDKVIRQRLQGITAVAVMASYLYRKTFIKSGLNVLVESKRDRFSGRLTGYTDNYIKVLFDGPDELMKKIVPVRIEDANLGYTLAGILS